jgi:hypothetical protein
MTATRTRTVVMTVHKIEANLHDVTQFDDLPDSRFYLGNTWVEARGGADSHRWRLTEGQRAWVGDRVTVTIIEDDPDDEPWATDDPPTDDRRKL